MAASSGTRKAGKRRRRSAEEARRAILDVAERRFLEGGPASLRLQEIAAEVGVSHPTILHHFGSREGLVGAVVERAMAALDLDLVRALAEPDLGAVDVAAVLERAFDTLGRHGQARMVAWLTLSREGDGSIGPGTGRFLTAIADLVHARRRAAWTGAGTPRFEDSQFVVMLAAVALFGDALLGPAIRESSGLGGDPDAERRFRRWLAELLVRVLSPEDTRPPRRTRRR